MPLPRSYPKTVASKTAHGLSSSCLFKRATAFLPVFAAFQLNAADSPIQLELATTVRTNFLSRTNGVTQLFSKSVNGTEFARNPKFWLRATIGPQATHVGGGPGVSAITPWHVLGANHWKQDVGARLCFCDAVGRTVARTVVAGTEIRPDIKSDLWLAVLDKALPDSIAPLPLMPSDWTNHIGGKPLLVTAVNQRSEFGLATLISLRPPVDGWFRYGYSYTSSDLAPHLPFVPLRAGDSGHPIMTLVETNLVLLGHITLEYSRSNFSGPDYSSYAADIQTAIASLGTNSVARTQKLRTIHFEPPYSQ